MLLLPAPLAPAAEMGLFLLGFAAALFGLAAARARTARARATLPEELEALRRISSGINRGDDLLPLLDNCLEQVVKVCGVQAGAVLLESTADGMPPRAVYHGFPPSAKSALDGIGLPAASSTSDSGTARHREDEGVSLSFASVLRGQGYGHVIALPIRSGGRRHGMLVAADPAPWTVTPALRAFLEAASEMAASAIAGARLREQALKLAEEFTALQELNKIISQSLDLEDIIQRIVIEGKRLAKTPHCHLFLLDDRQQRLLGSASTQFEVGGIRSVEVLLSEEALAVAALKEKRVIAVEALRQDPRASRRLLEIMKWRSAIFAPLIAKERTIGVLICSDDTRENRFSQEEILRAETLAHQAAIALENARLFHVVSRSQKEWETTFDAMQDCVSVHDTSGVLIRANVALARRLQTTPQKLIGKACAEIYSADPLGFTPCQHTRPLEEGGVVVAETRIASMGGVFQISVTPWYDKNNQLVGSIHVAKDVSHEKQLQQQLIQSEKLSAIGELISGIAHELNNPLTGVMGYAQLLDARGDLDDRARDNLHKINSLAMRCQKIVQNLLSFARKQKPERKLSSLNDMLERVIELRHYELSVNNIEVVRELEPNLPMTIADAHQLQQVFLNVITNAEQAMLQAHGRGKLTIRSRANRPENRLIVEIRDDGPGIPERHLIRIFDPFFTTKEVGQGTGLGLSLSYGIVKEHGGNIRAESGPCRGTAFVIDLPIITRPDADYSISPEMKPPATQFDSVLRDKRMLVVDDEEYILDFFVEVFRTLPVTLDTASNGHQAMEMLAATDYDVIITDFKMPQMGGRDLYRWVKSERPEMANRILFVTGDTVSRDTQSFFEQTSARYLAKPFKIEEIKEQILNLLTENPS